MCFNGQEPEQTEALPLVVSTPKRKRTKVTDTRLSPRAARALLHDSLHLHPPVDSYAAPSNSVCMRGHASKHSHLALRQL